MSNTKSQFGGYLGYSMNQLETYFYDNVMLGDAEIISVSFNQKYKALKGTSKGHIKQYPSLEIEFMHPLGEPQAIYEIRGNGLDRRSLLVASVLVSQNWFHNYKITNAEVSKLYQKIENLILIPIDEYTHGAFTHDDDFAIMANDVMKTL